MLLRTKTSKNKITFFFKGSILGYKYYSLIRKLLPIKAMKHSRSEPFLRNCASQSFGWSRNSSPLVKPKVSIQPLQQQTRKHFCETDPSSANTIFKIHFNIISLSAPASQEWFSLQGFLRKFCTHSHLPHIRYMPLFLGLTTPMIRLFGGVTTMKLHFM